MKKYSATTEVYEKSDAQIERETAKKWCARALACFAKYDKTGNLEWFTRAENYRHESIEHASTIGDYGRTVAKLQKTLDKAHKKAVEKAHRKRFAAKRKKAHR